MWPAGEYPMKAAAFKFIELVIRELDYNIWPQLLPSNVGYCSSTASHLSRSTSTAHVSF